MGRFGFFAGVAPVLGVEEVWLEIENLKSMKLFQCSSSEDDSLDHLTVSYALRTGRWELYEKCPESEFSEMVTVRKILTVNLLNVTYRINDSRKLDFGQTL